LRIWFLCSIKFLFKFVNFLFQKVNKIFIGFVSSLIHGKVLASSSFHRTTHTFNRRTCWTLILHIFHILDLLFQSLYNFLAEMTSLGKFLLNLFMNLNISLQGFNLSLHLIVSVQELLRLLWLVLQLSGQLMILQNG